VDTLVDRATRYAMVVALPDGNKADAVAAVENAAVLADLSSWVYFRPGSGWSTPLWTGQWYPATPVSGSGSDTPAGPDNDPRPGALAGATALVTGANSGIGKATSRALAALGATVLMTVRDGDRGETARREILAALPDGRHPSRGVRRLPLVRVARLRR